LPAPGRAGDGADDGTDAAPALRRPLDSRATAIRCWQSGVPIFDETGISSMRRFEGGIQIDKPDGTTISVVNGGLGGGHADGGFVCVTRYGPLSALTP
jgi:hypothetical protein